MIERSMAVAATIVVPIAVRVLPFRVTLALCDLWPRTPGASAAPAVLARRVDRWLARGRAFWRPTCLIRSMVLYTMLRQHGHAPRLQLGACGLARRFRAHAWVSLGDTPVAEFDQALHGYRPLVTHGA